MPQKSPFGVAYFCREIRDSYRDKFEKLSQQLESSWKFYLDSEKFSGEKKKNHDKLSYPENLR